MNTKRMHEKRWRLNLFGRLIRIRIYAFLVPFSCNESGLWPLGIQIRRNRINGHFLQIADAGIVIE